MSRRPIAYLSLALGWFMMARAAWSGEAGRVEFNRDIRPILSENCFACHGPDKGHRKADLRLDTKDGIASDRVVVPGDPASSELFRRITSPDPEARMPSQGSGKTLSGAQVATLKAWIEQGAKYQGHWSYLPPVRPKVPAPDEPDFSRNPVDRLIRAKLRENQLSPSPEADRATLLRRVSFDLTGLPPTKAELAAFLADRSPDAYETRVDRLLRSPRHGERMAQSWLDLVRFADTAGYHSDNPRSVWHYRDYVIRAFNENMPFDRFTVEQIAGDLLPGATREQTVASGYNRLLQTTEEGGAQAKEYEAKYAADRVRNVSTVWLGATMGCCQCHDHKFDPFTAREFYGLAAFFADVQENAVGSQGPGLSLPTDQQVAELARLEREITRVKPQAYYIQDDSPSPKTHAAMKELSGLLRNKTSLLAQIPTSLVTTSGPRRITRVLRRGDWQDESGEVVEPHVPKALGRVETPGRVPTRLDLARWIASRANPLTARVAVNRLWKLAFGQGLVRSLEDLGSQGEWPTHPELLDWLAVEFMDHGWDVRHIVRLLVTSRTYRQSSLISPALIERDPFNRFYARQSRFRLDAEAVRDNALAISGLLSTEVGGPSVMPYQPDGYWDALNFPPRTWQTSAGEQQYRRGIYVHWQRSYLHPSLQAFDAPTREECTADRGRSNVPQQALALLNDPSYVEAARAFASKVLREGGSTSDARVDWAFEVATSRRPSAREAAVLLGLLDKHIEHFRREPAAATKLLAVGQRPAPADLAPAELAAWTSVARVLLNLHETITRD